MGRSFKDNPRVISWHRCFWEGHGFQPCHIDSLYRTYGTAESRALPKTFRDSRVLRGLLKMLVPFLASQTE